MRPRHVAARDDGGLEVGPARELMFGQNRSIKWATITRDGKKAYGVQSAGGSGAQVLTVVQDWRATLGGG